MKFIYQKLKELLKEIEGIKYIDLDKGQMERYNQRPSVLFPAALIKITLPRCTDITTTVQDCTASITIRLAFDFTGDTSSLTPDDIEEESLAYFDLADEVYVKLQGWGNEEMNELSRRQAIPENRNDGYNVLRLEFSTEFQDDSADI